MDTRSKQYKQLEQFNDLMTSDFVLIDGEGDEEGMTGFSYEAADAQDDAAMHLDEGLEENGGDEAPKQVIRAKPKKPARKKRQSGVSKPKTKGKGKPRKRRNSKAKFAESEDEAEMSSLDDEPETSEPSEDEDDF